MSNVSDNNVINGVYVCHLDRNQDINTYIYKRNSTTKNDNNNLIRFPIPLNTRYTLQHVYDKKQNNEISTKSDYYINNIDTETLLRGTFHPLQHNSQKNIYQILQAIYIMIIYINIILQIIFMFLMKNQIK